MERADGGCPLTGHGMWSVGVTHIITVKFGAVFLGLRKCTLLRAFWRCIRPGKGEWVLRCT